MLPYFTQHPPPAENLLELKFRELVFNLFINPANAQFLEYALRISDTGKVSLQEIMDANFSFNLSLEEYAKLSQRSIASFKREFTNIYKMAPGKWLLQKRLDYSKMLLQTSSRSVNDIAYESGFENSTHFSRVFKDKFGASPLNFKKMFSNSIV